MLFSLFGTRKLYSLLVGSLQKEHFIKQIVLPIGIESQLCLLSQIPPSCDPDTLLHLYEVVHAKQSLVSLLIDHPDSLATSKIDLQLSLLLRIPLSPHFSRTLDQTLASLYQEQQNVAL